MESKAVPQTWAQSAATIAATTAVFLFAGCASQITTSNSTITSVCNVGQQEMLTAVHEVVAGMKNYKYAAKSNTEASVKYNPTNPLMGSATILVRVQQATGFNKDGERVQGAELTYTDVTPFLSQDTAFGGGDIIGQLKASMAEYMEFKGIRCETAKRH